MSVPDHNQIFNITSEKEFNALALTLFAVHARENVTYRTYLKAIGCQVPDVAHFADIPMLPIQFFRSRSVLLDNVRPALWFESSTTTGAVPSRHGVVDAELYHRSFTAGFERVYGPVHGWRILALLPGYLERGGSSLVYMAHQLIEATGDKFSGMYLDKFDELAQVLQRSDDRPTMLLGVSFALLDLAERHPGALHNTTIVETGGMKGRRKEMVRAELHNHLTAAFHVPSIHSEYGMTELFSQAWSTGNGRFTTPPWMRVLVRDTSDPFTRVRTGRTGGIDIIDLANVHSCPFIATKDLGKCHADNSFEVLGRFDHSEVRGCNLLVM